MKIHNPLTNEYVINEFCNGCLCHEFAIQFGQELKNGCCAECGCPKNVQGFNYFRANIDRKQQ
ncbi:MAG: hypothetical protein HYW78_02850 [Parcubacteria group bacterium]|nr:hypothetical protein [Parcubacteria group bacterium]